ncbi:recombinase family protein [Paraburkholderia pallida]|uniref:Recombinase family protein n=1 Tax=Paraburkholderia pallida TaxID=2547399 RepID=A0A4P7CTH4_9BURK|nr:recombinase family protein [Paraburkholderia pallida]QBQ98437.1 recombinase family protein [Paraburkholderia pallida]
MTAPGGERGTVAGWSRIVDIDRAREPVATQTNVVRAAEYVRMSTEHQQYSTENQRDRIRDYAAHRGFTIVRTYADEGKSGLRIDGRQALQSLIKDVESGAADFQVILVYDVSRWGRFQDADESAYYEYICRRAGIQVAYCAEQFENDGSPVSTIVKGVKRAMAGEYSRELSAKVFAGQCRLIELGFRQGGPAGYGLRRILVDQHGLMKSELQRGDHKSLQTDRVILMPGPENEVRTVNLIYRWFIDDSLNEYEIAARLNGMHIQTDLDRDWTRASVREVLTNEKYIGNNIYNRVSFKLKKTRVVNPPEMWIRKDGAFEPVVPSEAFYTAQGIMRARARRYSSEELIERLRNLYRSRGFLSGIVIDETEGMPSAYVYAYHFGSLIRAYQAVGFTPGRDYQYIETNRFLRQLHPGIVAETETRIAALGGIVTRDPATDMLTVNCEFTACIVLSRCQAHDSGRNHWKVRFDTSLLPDITVAVRLDCSNQVTLDYYLLPRLDFGQPRIHLADWNSVEFESYRFDTLDYLYGMAQRARLRRAA